MQEKEASTNCASFSQSRNTITKTAYQDRD